MSKDYSDFFGWIDDPKTVEQSMQTMPYPVFGDIGSSIKGSGKGKKQLLYKLVIEVTGKFPNRKQTGPDCVSMGAACAVDIIKCVDIKLHRQFEDWVAETATEDIYGGSRVQIGKGQLGNSGGSFGSWAAKYITQYGAIPRGKYGNVDLTKYDYNKAKYWGSPRVGTPKTITDKAAEHPVLIASQVRTWEEVCDLMYNGYAVTIASNQGFKSVRDKEGFAAPEGQWPHQMCLIGYDDEYKRPGALCQNSWGTWNSGPKRHDQPDGSFWIDAEDLERRILKSGDCWAFSGYDGFKPQEIDCRIW